MPIYTMTNKRSKKTEDMTLTWEKMDEMVKSGKWEREFQPPNFGNTSMDSGKLPEAFKDRMREAKKKHPLAKGLDKIL